MAAKDESDTLLAPAEESPAPEVPHLPASFFSKLVRQPSCLTKGVCDNCGRCEH